MDKKNLGFHHEFHMEQFKALREEICQSIKYQHQILLAGYAAITAVVALAARQNDLGLSPMLAAVAAGLVPFAFLALGSLWCFETNRMVRAGLFIADQLELGFHHQEQGEGFASAPEEMRRLLQRRVTSEDWWFDRADLESFRLRLKKEDAVSSLLLGRMKLDKWLLKDINVSDLATAIVGLLKGNSIYEEDLFKGMHLRPETKKLLSSQPAGEKLVELNRLLLEDACELPGALRRGLPRTLDNFWESWLRNIDDNRSMARDFNARQHRVQLFFVVLLPWVASVAALSCASCSKALQDWPWWGFLLAYLFYGVSWGWLYKQVRSVTDLEYARKSAVAGGNLLLMLRRVCKDWFVAAALTVSLGVIPGCLAWAKSPIAGNQPAEYVLSYSTNAQSSGMVLHLANVILMPYTNQSGANASAPSPTNQTVEWRLEIGTNGNGAGAVLRLPHFEMIRTN